MGTCQYPDCKSMIEKNAAPSNRARVSSILGSGYTSLIVTAFRRRKSTQNLHVPSFFLTRTTAAPHGLFEVLVGLRATKKQSPYSTNTSRIFSLSVGVNPSPILLSNSCSRSAFFSAPAVATATGVSPSLISVTGSIIPNTVPSSIHCWWSDNLVIAICPIVPMPLTRTFPVDTLFVLCNAWDGSTSALSPNPFKSSG
ncbi:hypothetical protein OUZ56_029942 [Daphnia magna]|uniref:Uncharacterized protein n=1 Tax=Daphnia magna TaxID=35525 RepID=A0ABR0B893_9CRUS|nr:hypothetical protein OUZ56_029942 [Daphnia magna]